MPSMQVLSLLSALRHLEETHRTPAGRMTAGKR